MPANWRLDAAVEMSVADVVTTPGPGIIEPHSHKPYDIEPQCKLARP